MTKNLQLLKQLKDVLVPMQLMTVWNIKLKVFSPFCIKEFNDLNQRLNFVFIYNLNESSLKLLPSVIHALPCIVTAFKSSGTIKKFHVFISFNPCILIFYWVVDFEIQKRNILNSDELAKENASNQKFNVFQANIKITWLWNNILVLCHQAVNNCSFGLKHYSLIHIKTTLYAHWNEDRFSKHTQWNRW